MSEYDGWGGRGIPRRRGASRGPLGGCVGRYILGDTLGFLYKFETPNPHEKYKHTGGGGVIQVYEGDDRTPKYPDHQELPGDGAVTHQETSSSGSYLENFKQYKISRGEDEGGMKNINSSIIQGEIQFC